MAFTKPVLAVIFLLIILDKYAESAETASSSKIHLFLRLSLLNNFSYSLNLLDFYRYV